MNEDLFTAVDAYKAVTDENGNTKLVKIAWDGTWASLFEEENEDA